MSVLKLSLAISLILSLSLYSEAYPLSNDDTVGKYLRRELNALEYQIEEQRFLDQLEALFSDSTAEKKTTSPSPTTSASPTTAPAPQTTSSSVNTVYIQHVVNCYKAYSFVTERGLSELDTIYNIVNVNCMTDPKVVKLIRILTDYALANDKYSGSDISDVIEWLFSVTETELDSAEETEDESVDESGAIETTVAPIYPTTTVAKTTVARKTTVEPESTTVVNQRVTEEVIADESGDTTSSFLTEDEEAVRELLLQRILRMLKDRKAKN